MWFIEVMKIPEILDSTHIKQAVVLVKEYYTEPVKRGEVRTGARFESWMGGGDAPEVINTITADDLIAVTFLSVEIPAAAAIGILETHKDTISGLLEQIPSGLDLANIRGEDMTATLGPDSAADQLWRLLRQSDAMRWGIGQTTTSKIIARKRPRLIPIYDSVVGPLMGLKNSGKQWTTWYDALTDGTGLPERLNDIHIKSGVASDASPLRIMDVVLWMYGKKLGIGA